MTDTNGLSELCGRLADVATTLETQNHPGAADVRAAIGALRRKDPSKILAAAKAYRAAMEDPNIDGEHVAMLAQRLLSAAEGVGDLGDDERDRRIATSSAIATDARDLHAKITQIIVPALDQIAVALEAQAERGAAATRRFKVGDRVRVNDKGSLRDIGMVGTVLDPLEDESVRVKNGCFVYAFHPEVLDRA